MPLSEEEIERRREAARKHLAKVKAEQEEERLLQEAARLQNEQEARNLLLQVEERRRQQEKKKKSNEPVDMDGVDPYPLIRTMNEKERARLPAEKRKQPSKSTDGQIPVEQEGDEDVLMHGRPEVWKAFGPFFGRAGKTQPKTEDDDDDFSM